MNKQSSLLLTMLTTTLTCGLLESSSQSRKHLILTDSVKATLLTTTSFAAISADGSKVFFKPFGGFGADIKFPPGTVPQPPFTQAILYKNAKGKLQVEKSIPLDLSTFPNSDGAGASQDFKRFVIIDDNGIFSNKVIIRIRTLDANFNVIATKIDSNVEFNAALFAPSIGFPVFTNDNKFFVVGLQTKNNQSLVRLYETDTLNVVFEYNIGQTSSTEGQITSSGIATYFPIYKNGKQLEYFALPIALVNPTANLPGTISADIQVLQLIRGANPTLTLVNKTPLPQQGISISSLQTKKSRKLNYAILSLTTMRADLPGEIITFQVPQPSVLPKDGDELRVYKVTVGKNDKVKLKLIASQNLKNDGGAVASYPLNKGKTIALSIKNFPLNFYNNLNEGDPAAPQAFSLREITGKPTDRVAKLGFNNIDQLYSVSDENNFAQFSQNGRWLVVTGDKGEQDFVPTPSKQANLGVTNNLNLFKVCGN